MVKHRFELNEQTRPVVEEIGGNMPGGFFIYQAEKPEKLIYANKAVINMYGCTDLEDFKAYTRFEFKGIIHEFRDINVSCSAWTVIDNLNSVCNQVSNFKLVF